MSGPVEIDRGELQRLLTDAAEAGAVAALHRLGLHDEDAPDDVRDLRMLLDSWRQMKSAALKTFAALLVKGLLLALILGALFFLKIRMP